MKIAAWLRTGRLALLAWLCCAGPALAAGVATRIGVHPGFDRVVFNIAAGMAFTTQRDGDVLIVHCPAAGAVAGAAGGSGRVRAVAGGIDMASITLVHDATIRIWRLDGRVVVDVFAPGAAQAGHAATAIAAKPPLPETAPPARKIAATSMTPLAPPSPPPFSSGAVVTATPLSVLPQPDPSSLAVILLPSDPVQGSAAILVPFGASVGAAAFRRGDTGYVVFDAARDLDLASISIDAMFGSARVERLETGTVLRLVLPRDAELRLERRMEGWVVRASRNPAPLAAILAHPDKGRIILAAANPGQVLIVRDAATGGRLMVGTQLGAGEHVAAAHRSPLFALWPSWQGVLVEPAGDAVDLTPVKSGFILHGGIGADLAGGWRAPSEVPAIDAGALTRSFDFPSLPLAMLRLRLEDAQRDAASVPKLDRFDARLRVAQAMLALGMGVEAGAVLRAAAEDDPARGSERAPLALTAIAAWLAGRADAQGPDPPAALASDEALLWQAVLQSGQADATGPAAAFAVTWPLIMTYPQLLRARLIEPAAETMARGGQARMAEKLLAVADDPSLDLLRAEALQRSGKTDDALTLLDRISDGRDRKLRAQARMAATELRLQAHRIDATAAEDQLAKQLYAWRGDARERALRLRVAELRAQQGGWRAAMTMLRETDALFPEAHDDIHAAEIKLLGDLLKDDAANRMKPLDLAALADECSGLLTKTESGARLAPVLVDKLLALELPDRAEPILHDMLARTEAPLPKAELGVRLASLRLERGDPAGASQALDASVSDALPDDLIARRTVLLAKIRAASGDVDGALAALAGIVSADAFDLRAQFLERGRHWAAAAAALAEAVQRGVTGAGILDEAQQNLVLRLAGDLAQAGDMAALRQLQARFGGRFGEGGRAALFHVLTQPPVEGVGDLPRAGQDLLAAQALPASLAVAKPR